MSTAPFPTSDPSQPTWQVAKLFPLQGHWSVADYFELTELTSKLVEFKDGSIEVVEVPTKSHQLILWFLLDALRGYVLPRKLGEVSFAPLKVRLSPAQYREPDIVFMLAEHADRAGEEYWDGADLVMEIVSASPGGRRRDLETKRRDYAAASISEYWIVDPQEQAITVLTCKPGEHRYGEHGTFAPGGEAASALLAGFSVDVASVFAVART